ncbi:hypothetical protein [Nannocystis sp.]|uniref:hypothetical protein n=1 Tax=Nannocystis sp. TaxID=1962667 RepID=UPI0025D547B0|nr:hypothetical protein [Nannocystis sp.]MBK7828482.1 hypothetical protein [Nannocystis sp.]
MCGRPVRAPRARLGLAFGLLLAAPATAHAGNGLLPRTPVLHQDEHCLTVVDRSAQPVVHLRYTIPYSDVCLSADEPADSRSHQMLAFCHGDPAARPVPRWHTRGELERDIAAGFGPPDPVFAEDVLEDSPDYAGCWHLITAPGEHRPITCAAARPGVDWDTRDLPVGTYLVRGYTYEPPGSAWWPRHGLFKIVDDASDPAASPPALAIANRDTFLWKGQVMRVRLCVDAMPGTTVTLAHGRNIAEPAWSPFIVDMPVVSGTVDLDFQPPAELAGEFLTLRAEIVDPQDRRFIAFMQGEISVQVSSAPAGEEAPVGVDDEPPPTSYDYCVDDPAADAEVECPAPASTTSPDTSDDPAAGEPGCGCRGPAPLPLLAPLLVLLRRRPRLRPGQAP